MQSMRPIQEVAGDLGLDPGTLIPWGRSKAKIEVGGANSVRPKGKLVLVSAISPTEQGEGKTTMSVALSMGLWRRGVRTALCLREPSLGPVFGKKGGGTGGGLSQVVPSEDINLHFTGDMHAITSAHNLLSALVDNELHFGAKSGLDPRRVSWPRVMDMNDRALRHVLVGLGGRIDGVPREARFDITAASEIMACLCLSRDLTELRSRLLKIRVGSTSGDHPVTAADIGGVDAMLALLRDAMLPNLAQTREGTPALIHGGPFANIAHGCSSLVATELGLSHADVVVTEAGFGFDLGGEKFMHIKCRRGGLSPALVVLVCTVRALRSHGRGDLKRGLVHLTRQLDNVGAFGVRAVVAINRFPEDTEEELRLVEAHCSARGVNAARCEGFTRGSEGALSLADAVQEALRGPAPNLTFLYPEGASVEQQLSAIATRLYGARDVAFSDAARKDLVRLSAEGNANLPVCVAKTPLSFSDQASAGGLAEGFVPTVTELRPLTGAGFVVALMGEQSTMPGLPKQPAALRVQLDAHGRAHGLMQGD